MARTRFDRGCYEERRYLLAVARLAWGREFLQARRVDDSSLESLCERLAREVAEELEDHPGKRWRCPRDLRSRIVSYAGVCRERGEPMGDIEALARHLEPTYEALCSRVLEADVVFADETFWRNHEGKDTSRWWTWCVASDEIATYRMLSSRSKRAAGTVLKGFEGVVMTDGYGAYQALERAAPDLHLAHCWAHVRRRVSRSRGCVP